MNSIFVLRVLQIAFVKEAVAQLSNITKSNEQATSSRKKHTSMQQKVDNLWNTSKLFNLGIEKFEGMDFVIRVQYTCMCSLHRFTVSLV